MIRRIDASRADELIKRLESQPELSVRISALLKAYGTETGFFDVWEQNGYAAVFARLDSSFFALELASAGIKEAAGFLSMHPYYGTFFGKADLLMRLARCLNPSPKVHTSNLLISGGAPPVCRRPRGAVIIRKPGLRAVYEVISGAGPVPGGFMSWYTDMSHRIRHGCARAYLMRDGGTPASACLVSAESHFAGLISGVVTKPEYRGRGYASALVEAARADLLMAGKRPLLECEDALLPFYKRLGFEKFAEMGEMTLKGKAYCPPAEHKS